MKAKRTIPPEEQLLLTIEETAAVLGIGRDAIFKIALGPQPVLKSFFIGKKRMFPRKAISDYIDQQLNKAVL